MIRSAVRRSRKPRRCEVCRRPIPVGALYCESVISPNHGEVGNIGWWRAANCHECAAGYGHDHLFVARERTKR